MTIQEQVSSIQGGRSRLWLALFWVNHALIQIGLFQVYNRQVCYFKHWTPCTSLSTSARIPTLPSERNDLIGVLEEKAQTRFIDQEGGLLVIPGFYV